MGKKTEFTVPLNWQWAYQFFPSCFSQPDLNIIWSSKVVTEAQRGLPLILTRKVGKVTPKTLRKKQKSQFFSFHYFLFSHTPAPKQSCASSRRGRNGSPQEPKIWGRAPPLYLVELWFQENRVNTVVCFLSLCSLATWP